ncbi:MAG: AAA family ATPase [Treponema sp.]|jgi:MoxR-like ATPase|nr:AAA family ATPase [Treponema sp.]
MDQPGGPFSAAELFSLCRGELAKRIAGQKEMMDGLLAALVAGGHVLLEGVPGLAKTLTVKSLAEITGLAFKRIQFTPDLLPADLTGTLVWEQGRGDFSVRRGPLFANVILADEINRAPAKVQSALLEAMEEKQVTIGETSYPLPNPFFVLATQNPIEQEGTYALPEAELDRFLVKLLVSYPSPEEEMDIVGRNARMGAPGGPALSVVLDAPALAGLREAANAVLSDEKIARYIVSLVSSTRPLSTRSAAGLSGGVSGGSGGAGPVRLPKEGFYRHISYGASPRASIALHRLSRIFALMEGRSFVTPEDVKAAAFPVLRHRVVLSYEAEADGLDTDAVISRILSLVPIP